MRQVNSSPKTLRTPRRRQARGARANRACVSCKEKKLKCDDNSPACGNCKRFGSTCLIEDPETKKQRPRNYLETLEERLSLFEQRTPPQDPPETSGPSPSALPSSGHGSQKSLPAFTSEACSGGDSSSDLPSKVGLLDVKTTQVEPQYLGSSSAFAFAHVINSSLRGAIGQRPSLGPRSSSQVETTFAPCPFPEYNIAVKLSNAYFENIQPQYPFLHEPTFRHCEEKLLGQSSDVTNTMLYSVPLFFINMVYAVGALLVPGYQYLAEVPNPRPHNRYLRLQLIPFKQLYSSAQLYHEVLSLDNLEAIQAILCYSMYSLRSANGPSLWKLSGLALRQCIELGYHRSTKRVVSSQGILQGELRKRAFWCAQGIDCTYALRLGRPLGIQLHEIDAELPLDLDDAHITDSGIHSPPRSSCGDAPTSMSNAIHVIHLRRIWARIHACASSATTLGELSDGSRHAHVAQLRSDLEEWRATAPEPPPRSGDVLSIFSTRAWYDLNYSGTILHLYREQLAEGKQAPDHVFLDCMQASSTVCQLYRRQYIGTSINHTWGTLHCLFLAGLTYLHCLWASPVVFESVQYHEVSKTCNDCTMVLVVIAQEWKGAAPYRDIFEVLASQTMSMIVARNCQHQPLPTTPLLPDTSDREAVTRWMADMDDMGMLDGFDCLLSGFMDDFTPCEMNDNGLS